MERRSTSQGMVIDIRSISEEDVADFQNAAIQMREERHFSIERLAGAGDTVIDDTGVIKVNSGQKVIVLRGSIEQITEFDQVLLCIKTDKVLHDSQE